MLRQNEVITDRSHFIDIQRGVLFVAKKAITVRTSKISSCLPHIFLMYNPISTGVSREGTKITTTSKCLTISFGARTNRYKTDKNSNIIFLVQINGFQTRAFVICSSLRNRKCRERMSLLNHRLRIQLIVSRA